MVCANSSAYNNIFQAVFTQSPIELLPAAELQATFYFQSGAEINGKHFLLMYTVQRDNNIASWPSDKMVECNKQKRDYNYEFDAFVKCIFAWCFLFLVWLSGLESSCECGVIVCMQATNHLWLKQNELYKTKNICTQIYVHVLPQYKVHFTPIDRSKSIWLSSLSSLLKLMTFFGLCSMENFCMQFATTFAQNVSFIFP